jgi:hypothetical protein
MPRRKRKNNASVFLCADALLLYHEGESSRLREYTVHLE